MTSDLPAAERECFPSPSDGNCLFRAVADQIAGDEGDHISLRERTVAHMRANPDDFSPFVEDDETFDDYLERMGEVACAGPIQSTTNFAAHLYIMIKALLGSGC